MKRYKLTYPVQLKSSGGFCTTPMEIMRQMDEARDTAETGLNEFLQREKLEDQVEDVTPVPHQIGLIITCTEDVARRLKNEKFVESITEDDSRPLPAQVRIPPKFDFPGL